jgi:hypothetical protein
MKTKDLRLGNYVADSSGFTMYVIGIYDDTVLLNFKGNEGDVWEVYEKDLRGIMLDTELLIKSGFKRQVTGIGWDKYSNGLVDLSLAPLSNGSYIPIYHVNGEYVQIKYLHQLQNLFYALTQKELEINL